MAGATLAIGPVVVDLSQGNSHLGYALKGSLGYALKGTAFNQPENWVVSWFDGYLISKLRLSGALADRDQRCRH
jgi:hypothetical protein